jgi:hypothetical protein
MKELTIILHDLVIDGQGRSIYAAMVFVEVKKIENSLPIIAAMLTPRAIQPCRITMFMAAGDLTKRKQIIMF